MSEPVEVQFRKPRRRIWKIIVPLILMAILIPLLMYAYAHSALENSYSKSWETISFPELDEMPLEKDEFTQDIVIRNPTGMSIELVAVSFDAWIDGNKFATVRDADIYLPAGGSATIPCTLCYDSQIMNSILSTFYNQTIRVENVVSANVFSMPITRTFIVEDSVIIQP